MTREEAQGMIDKELTRAREAHTLGNEGKVRVCARRAAGVAITFWLQSHETMKWGLDNMNQLQSVVNEERIPQTVRDAAVRLTTKITEQSTSPFSIDPVEDGRILVEYFLT